MTIDFVKLPDHLSLNTIIVWNGIATCFAMVILMPLMVVNLIHCITTYDNMGANSNR
jgi:hypothetical protein